MIKTELIVVCLLLITSCNNSSYATNKNKPIGELTEISKVIIDCFLKDKDNRSLDNSKSVIIMSFRNDNKKRTLVINDESNELYEDLGNCLYTRYKNFLIIVKGVPDDIFFITDIDKNLLQKELRKKIKENKRRAVLIEKGKYKGEIPIYSEYDPFVYYYITYSDGKILETTPSVKLILI